MRTTETTARSEALEKAILGIHRQFGAGSIQRLDGSIADLVGDPISSGSLGLDLALGVGGYPRGRMVEIYGPEASGKTTLALQAIASAATKPNSHMLLKYKLCNSGLYISIYID